MSSGDGTFPPGLVPPPAAPVSQMQVCAAALPRRALRKSPFRALLPPARVLIIGAANDETLGALAPTQRAA